MVSREPEDAVSLNARHTPGCENVRWGRLRGEAVHPRLREPELAVWGAQNGWERSTCRKPSILKLICSLSGTREHLDQGIWTDG